MTKLLLTSSPADTNRLAAWLLAAALVGIPLVRPAAADDAPSSPPATPATQPADNSLTIGAAEPTDIKADQLATWFNQLDAADAKVRDSAYNHLLSLKTSDLEMLRQVVKAAPSLRPGQISVLPGIVKQVYLSGMAYDGDASQGFLGVSLLDCNRTEPGNPPPPVPHPGLIVDHCMVGFGGARSLREGDVILSIVERPEVKIDGFNAFAQTVQQFNAGQVIHMEVLRQDRVIRVPVELDARPIELNGAINPEMAIEEMQQHRDDAANEYWTRAFVPLFKGGTS